MKKIKKMFGLMIAFLLVVGLAGCGSADDDAGEATDADTPSDDTEMFQIAIMPKLVGIPYFTQTGEGAEQAGEDLGVEVIYTGPTKADAAEQVKMIEDLINRDVDAIAVAPNDPAAVLPVLQKAKDAGILILDWDTPTNSDIIDASIHQIDNTVLGETLVEELVANMGVEEGEYAIVTGGLSASNLNSWIDASQAHIEANYPNLNLVTDKIPSDEKQEEAYSKTLDLVKAYPEIDGILGYSTVAPLGVAQAIRELGMQDEIAVVGTAVKEDSQEFLEDGSLDVGMLWDPTELGYLTVGVAKALLEGEDLEDGMDIEGFGEIELKEDGRTIIMGPPAIYKK